MVRRILALLVDLGFSLVATFLIMAIVNLLGLTALPHWWPLEGAHSPDGGFSLSMEELMSALYTWLAILVSTVWIFVSFGLFVSWSLWDFTPGKWLLFRKQSS